ncbi:hypothetical protein MNBD_GAMMA22-2235 [hydrothermal vent metagenome]|uniref:Cytochrome c domain-containing protein n=1 Tax=hydrothermal vent metagenome TaxID=652676 RepID=A0A3B1AT58_9ZZZZ
MTTALFFTSSISIAQQLDLKTKIHNGKRIYQQGILPNGKPLTGIGAGNITLFGSQASCIRCHRRSAFGSTEGDLRIPAILGDILYSERNKSDKELSRRRTTGHGARPAYTDNTLLNAITQGSGADQRTLNKLMPRYQLTKNQSDAVIEYLKSLTLKTDLGVTKENIHIATIYSSDVATKDTRVMLDLLNIFIKDVNTKTRQEQKRASNSPWHKRWEYESYRTIKLHAWKLTGLPETWKQQLEKFYATQNVFAVINGISNNSWDVIHQFCNNTKLPCLFPTTELPALAQNNIYNFYYSGGIAFDAKTIASHIKKLANNTNKTVLQVYRDNIKNKTAAKILKSDLLFSKITIKNHVVKIKNSLSAAKWSELIEHYKPSIIVSWLNADDVAALNTKAVNSNSLDRLYYSYSHLGDNYSTIITKNTEKSFLAYRYMLPKRKEMHMTRATFWAKRKKIDISNEKIIGNAFFAATLFNRSIKKMRAYLKRDYLVDMIESMLENNAFHSVYPNLSLGPDQRIASKGAYILGPLSNTDHNKKQNTIWIRH